MSNPIATITMADGRVMTAELYPNMAPRTVANFLHLIREGKASKQIAAILGISVNTVNRHRQNIIEKLSVGNSIEAITAATAMKLL